MVKVTIKLAIVGLIANALYQVVPPYYTNWQFNDALKELATYPGFRPTVPQIARQVRENRQGIRPPSDAERLRRQAGRPRGARSTTIDVSYEVVLKPIPGPPEPHVFAIHIEGDPPRFGSLTP